MRVKSASLAVGMIVFCVLAFGYGVKGTKGNLDLLVFQKQTLRVTETTGDLDSMRNGLRGADAMEGFLADNGDAWKFTVDRRRGEFSLLEGGAIPLLPGLRSNVSWDSFGKGCSSNECIRLEDAEAAARRFMEDNASIFPAGQDELYLDREGSGPFGNSIYFLRFQWVPQGIPVEGAGISFRINNGNLIQVSTSLIGKFELDTLPLISADTALDILSGYIGGSLESDRFAEAGSLTIVPTVPSGVEIEGFTGIPGTGISYALAYRFVFTREGETGTWEGLVDANTGEILRFVDINRYGWVHGVVYPADGHNNQADRPFPYVATGLPSPNDYSDIGGRFTGNAATLNLGAGKYTRIVDACGATTLTTTGGDADYGESVGQDCGVPNPNPGAGGNTYSSKVQYYHLTQVNMKARTYYPSNSWLNNSYITVNVNNSPTCNASSGGSSLYFYKAAGGCWNLGEIPGVSVHEWGHSFDNYDGSGGGSPPLETRADWTATLQYRDSCTGRGAFLGDDCHGYGDACTDCDGIREADYMKHSKQTPWTPANNGSVYSCSSGGYNGPCGWEDHCESGISTQALWDLVTRDLPSYCGLDLPTAWQLVERLSYLSMAQLGNMYNCNGSTKTSDGCGGSTLYTLFRALDDDGDGTANGTPHAAAIFAALKRHNIACGAAGDPTNQNQTSCPGLTAPVLSAIAGSEAVTLNVTPVANASRYFFYRNETGCDSGFTKVGSVFAPTTSFVDTTPVNGMTYYYRAQAMTGSDACAGPMSNCVTIVPQPCTGMIILDKSMAGCVNTQIGVTILDSTASSPVTLSVFSTSHPVPVEFTMANDPPGSATYTGSFQTTTGTPGAGQVGVQAGDTVTARYRDPDYCGEPNHDVDVSFPVDCTPPVITNVHVSAKTDSTATISWTTDEPANSRVYFGVSTPPATVAEDLVNFSTQHSLTITGLSGCTVYNYYVGSYDGAQNYGQNNNSGNYYSFRTDQRVYLYGPDTVESGTGIWTASGGG
ncbi:MAG TPA: hypothetical protein PKJ37_12890, partial [Acidobacteriota bacterium]|nr:hypothetical protein [Acidobacteriota bacterium]